MICKLCVAIELKRSKYMSHQPNFKLKVNLVAFVISNLYTMSSFRFPQWSICFVSFTLNAACYIFLVLDLFLLV